MNRLNNYSMNPKNKIKTILSKDPNWNLKWAFKDWQSYSNLLNGKIDKSNCWKKANSKKYPFLFQIIMFKMIKIKY
jgi:hypothetical protein